MFSPTCSSDPTDHVVSEFLDLLGWRHDRTGPKGRPFASSFDVLGLTLDLSLLEEEGNIVVKNKEGRADKIASKIEEVQRSKKMTLQDAQEIHGLLNFANGYFAGRALKYACFKIFSLVQKGEKPVSPLEDWCRDVITLLRSSEPRKIPLGLDTRSILSFTDGAWEKEVAGLGLGAVIIHETSGQSLVVQDTVHPNLLKLWKDLVGDHLICQIELFAVVLVRWELRTVLANRRVLLFVDNNSARGGLLKGRSSSPTMDDHLKAFYAAEVRSPAFWWVERVPSKSNPADEPSRGLGEEAAARWHSRLQRRFSCQSQMVEWLLKTRANKTLGTWKGEWKPIHMQVVRLSSSCTTAYPKAKHDP